MGMPIVESSHNGLQYIRELRNFTLYEARVPWTPCPSEGVAMEVIAEMELKKDARNRVTLPADEYERYYAKKFDDGHIELYPRIVVDPTISRRALAMMDRSMANFAQGSVGEPVDADALLAALGDD